MSHSKWLLVPVIFWASCAPRSAPPVLPPPARIVFDESTHNFGHAEQGSVVTHQFRFRNDGGMDLAIDNVRASCGCVAAAPLAHVVPPREHGTIEVSFDTAGDRGSNARTVSVYTNDPSRPVTTLTLTGAVDVDVAADPPALYVGHLVRGQVAPNDVRFHAANGVTVGPPDAGGRIVEARLGDAAGGKRLRIAIRKEAALGRFRDTVSVRTSSGRHPVITIPIVGVVDDGSLTAVTAEPQP